MWKIAFFCVFVLIPSGQALDFNWRNGQGELEKIQMANDCDFALEDLYNKSSKSGDECAKFCRDEDRCTHFTYSKFYGKPLCFIKNSKRLREDATSNKGYKAVCGMDCKIATCEPIWKPVKGLKAIEMADSCDFDGKAYKKAPASSGKECAQLCRRKKGCTHFTYTVDNLCYIHNLDDPEVILYPEYATACGRDCYTADCGIGPNDKVNLGLRPSDEVASADENDDNLSV